MDIPEMTKKKRYRFVHKRKGTFEGIYLGKEKTPDGDLEDTEFLTVAMDTSDGSGSEWLRRAKNAEATTSNLRPSLLGSIEEMNLN